MLFGAAVTGPISVSLTPWPPAPSCRSAATTEFRAEYREIKIISTRTGHGACLGPGSLLTSAKGAYLQ